MPTAVTRRPQYLFGGVILALLLAGLVAYKTAVFVSPAVDDGLVPAEFGGVSLRVELATTTTARERGLSGRVRVPEGYGMLFVFEKDGKHGFWMKETLVPLDIFWLDSKGQVVSIAANVATSSYPHVFYPSAAARYVLETAAGFARAHTIATGTPLRLQNFSTVSQ